MSSKEHTKRGRKMERRGPKEVKGWKTKNMKQLVSRIYVYKKTNTTSSKKGNKKYTKNLDDKQQQKSIVR
jgi:hypothetical protein